MGRAALFIPLRRSKHCLLPALGVPDPRDALSGYSANSLTIYTLNRLVALGFYIERRVLVASLNSLAGEYSFLKPHLLLTMLGVTPSP